MTFKESYRAEVKAFQELKSSIELLKQWKDSGADKGIIFDILTACIAAVKAIILLYKNIGEAWNDLASQIVSEKAALEALKAEIESTKDETNEKIDDVNNYLNGKITDLETTLWQVRDGLSTRINNLISWNLEHNPKIYTFRIPGDPAQWTQDIQSGTYYFIANREGDQTFDGFGVGIYTFTAKHNDVSQWGYPYYVKLFRSLGFTGSIVTINDHRYLRIDADSVPSNSPDVDVVYQYAGSYQIFTSDIFVQGF